MITFYDWLFFSKTISSITMALYNWFVPILICLLSLFAPKVSGFLCLMSCEVSAFTICLITLDRFIVLRFPFTQTRFRRCSALAACVLAWSLGVILAAVPLMPVVSHWNFYSQSGICVPLPITRHQVHGQRFYFFLQ